MKKIISKTVIALGLLGLLAGCATYETGYYEQTSYYVDDADDGYGVETIEEGYY